VQTILKPMSENTFSRYVEESITCYAKDLVLGKIATEEGVLEKLRSDIKRSLPDGISTKDNFLFELRDNTTDELVGYFWYMMQTKLGERVGFICDVLITPEFRRQGRATQVLREFQEKMKAEKVLHIALHVFGHNRNARNLYEKLGFQPTSIQMKKSLVRDSSLNSLLDTDAQKRGSA
jgi:ribosomal protein S18 acetylase RimI-like enzyme